jgi:tripartite motif-containing protein 9/67
VCVCIGKDDKGFAMYIDRQRSWFQHNSIHERRVEGGISTGSTVGVLLDLERHTLHFIVNEMPQGSVAFRDLYGVFYPAVSVNRGVTLTLHTGLFAPHMDYH